MTITMTDAEHYAALIADEVAALERGDLAGHDPEDLDDGDVVGTWLNAHALDVEVARSLTTGDVTAVEVTRTIGGPGCWVTFRAIGDAEVVAVWGGERAIRYVAAPTVADYLVDYAEAVSA